MGASLEVARRFAANLLIARERAGHSQEDLGFLASLHRTEIGLLEKGARVPRIDTLVKLAAALEIPLDCLLLDGISWNSSTAQAGGFDVSFASAPRHEGLSDA